MSNEETIANLKSTRTEIQLRNKSLRARIKHKRNELEGYLKEAERFNEEIKKLESEISENNKRFFEAGSELEKLTGQKRMSHYDIVLLNHNPVERQ